MNRDSYFPFLFCTPFAYSSADCYKNPFSLIAYFLFKAWQSKYLRLILNELLTLE